MQKGRLLRPPFSKPVISPSDQFAAKWFRVLDTASENAPELRRSRRSPVLAPGSKIDVQSRSVVVLRSGP